jgi:RNA polymerase sigma-70 factor (ECF subfamily)
MAEIPPTRASLLVRLRDPRDEAAWTEFGTRYGPLVYGYARKQGLQDADAADVAQEVLGAVISSIGGLDYDPARGAFRNWLFTIVRRKLSDWYAAPARRISGGGDTATQLLLEQCQAPAEVEAEWELEWERRLFALACEQVRATVTDVTWQAFWRTAVEGQPGKRVAADLGLSVAGVYLARSRVLHRLKEQVRCLQEP